MSESAVAAMLIDALAATAREAAGETLLVSFSFELVGAGAPARAQARIERQTRTLLFMDAEAFDAAGARLAAATAVRRILAE